MLSAPNAMIEADLDYPEIQITDTDWPIFQTDEWEAEEDLLDGPEPEDAKSASAASGPLGTDAAWLELAAELTYECPAAEVWPPPAEAALLRVPQAHSLWDVLHGLLEAPAQRAGRSGIRVFAAGEALAEFTVDGGALTPSVSLGGRPFVDACLQAEAPELSAQLQEAACAAFTEEQRPLLCRLIARALLTVARRVGGRPFELRPCPPSAVQGPRFSPMEVLLQVGRSLSDGTLDAAGRLFAALQREADDAWLLCHRLPDRCLPLPLCATEGRVRDIGYAAAVVRLAQKVLAFLHETGRSAGECQDFLAEERRLFGRDERFLRLAFDEQPPLLVFWHEDGCWCALAGPTLFCLARCPATHLGRVQALYRAQLAAAGAPVEAAAPWAEADPEGAEHLLREIPDCLAAGYVDMTTGALLSVRTLDSHPREVLDLVAAAAADLFQGANVSTIERLFKRHRGLKDDGHPYFQEMLIFSDNLTHAFLRCKKNTDRVVVFVCRKGANMGIILPRARLSLPGLEHAL